MSATFTEFLRELSGKMTRISEANRQTIEEWRGSVETLFRQMASWLSESDPDKVIQVERKEQEVTEPTLGKYRVPRLDLHVVGKWIGIIPKARHTVAMARPAQASAPQQATGRVDITDEVRRYVLYRLSLDGQDRWYIDDLLTDPKPLDQATFEAALMSYLR